MSLAETSIEKEQRQKGSGSTIGAYPPIKPITYLGSSFRANVQAPSKAFLEFTIHKYSSVSGVEEVQNGTEANSWGTARGRARGRDSGVGRYRRDGRAVYCKDIVSST